MLNPLWMEKKPLVFLLTLGHSLWRGRGRGEEDHWRGERGVQNEGPWKD
jgi:hypothetical protein